MNELLGSLLGQPFALKCCQGCLTPVDRQLRGVATRSCVRSADRLPNARSIMVFA